VTRNAKRGSGMDPMKPVIDMATLTRVLADARDAGEYAADMDLGETAEEAWTIWFDTKSDAWRARLNDNTEALLRATFALAWDRFHLRQVAAECVAANSNADALRRAQ
jgi:hypothetical protein